jgi:hypothetical protein
MRDTTTEFDKLAQRLHKKLTCGPVDAYRVEAIKALQRLQVSTHENRLEALQCFEGSLLCHERKQENASRILFFVSAALTDDCLCQATWFTLAASVQHTVQPRPPQAAD